jgi:hypothetical protein
MLRGTRYAGLSIAFLSFLPATNALGSVILVLTNKGSTPTSTTVTQGGTFAVSVELVSSTATPADQVTAVDYSLAASQAAAFKILGRNSQTSGSTFPLVYLPDTDPGVEPVFLTTTGGSDLGGSLSNVNAPVSNNTFEVADYTIQVAPNLTPGIYTISTLSNSGEGFVGPGPNFLDNTFAAQGSYKVTVVVPEPVSGAMMLGLGSAGLMMRRRSRPHLR